MIFSFLLKKSNFHLNFIFSKFSKNIFSSIFHVFQNFSMIKKYVFRIFFRLILELTRAPTDLSRLRVKSKWAQRKMHVFFYFEFRWARLRFPTHIWNAQKWCLFAKTQLLGGEIISSRSWPPQIPTLKFNEIPLKIQWKYHKIPLWTVDFTFDFACLICLLTYRKPLQVFMIRSHLVSEAKIALYDKK